DLTGAHAHAPRQEHLDLGLHLGIDPPGDEGPEPGPVDDQLERLDVLPPNHVDEVLHVGQHGVRPLRITLRQVKERFVLLRVLRRMRRLRGPARRDNDHGKCSTDHPRAHAHLTLPKADYCTTRTRGRGSMRTRPSPRRCAATTSKAGGPGTSGPALAQLTVL